MQVAADVRRSDLFHLNLYVYPRTRATYVYFGLLVLGVVALGPIANGDFSPKSLGLALLIGILVGLAGVVLLFLICVAAQSLSVSKNTGVLGPRTYTLQDDGFAWDGEASSGKQKWKAIRSVLRTQNYVLISITPRLYFLVPRRAFPSGEAFNAFFDQALTLWKKSNP